SSSRDLDPYPGNDAPMTSTPSTAKSLFCAIDQNRHPKRLSFLRERAGGTRDAPISMSILFVNLWT
ncbi:hypothetical protein ACJH6H_25790, partial [Mycobacterium sp. SMC-21]|uniref:hypothetical protein n=1 Tax=Mycobacterium sp. SMC-21 TaxID=3381632 RepID=UPI003876F150